MKWIHNTCCMIFVYLINVKIFGQLVHRDIQIRFFCLADLQYLLGLRRRPLTRRSAPSWRRLQRPPWRYSAVQCSTVPYRTVPYRTVPYITVQYSTVQYSTVQYSTVLRWPIGRTCFGGSENKGPGWTSSSTYYAIYHQFPHRKCANRPIHKYYDNIHSNIRIKTWKVDFKSIFFY